MWAIGVFALFLRTLSCTPYSSSNQRAWVCYRLALWRSHQPANSEWPSEVWLSATARLATDLTSILVWSLSTSRKPAHWCSWLTHIERRERGEHQLVRFEPATSELPGPQCVTGRRVKSEVADSLFRHRTAASIMTHRGRAAQAAELQGISRRHIALGLRTLTPYAAQVSSRRGTRRDGDSMECRAALRRLVLKDLHRTKPCVRATVCRPGSANHSGLP